MTYSRVWRPSFARSRHHPALVTSEAGDYRLIKGSTRNEFIIQRRVGGHLSPWALATVATSEAEAIRAWLDRTGETLTRLDLTKGRAGK